MYIYLWKQEGPTEMRKGFVHYSTLAAADETNDKGIGKLTGQKT